MIKGDFLTQSKPIYTYYIDRHGILSSYGQFYWSTSRLTLHILRVVKKKMTERFDKVNFLKKLWSW